MEQFDGGGGGGRSHGGGALCYKKSPQNNLHFPPLSPRPFLYNYGRSSPPFSALDRFLSSHVQINHDQNNILNQNRTDEDISISSNGFSSEYQYPPILKNNFYFELGGTTGLDVLRTDHHGFNTKNGGSILIPGIDHTQNWDKNEDQNQEILISDQLLGKRRRVKKGGYPSNLIKGQWTVEEDRKLLKLVEQHGVRKWAHIAEEMLGRAGKQCRERWQNHLRPDIKKDRWSEEEEKMLIEAHQNLGNKWADIAKRIPGRSENSIKNHWNATKRRQNSKRKNKKNAESKNGSSNQLSLLQDYIKTKILAESNQSSTNSSTSTTTNLTPANSITSIVSNDPSIKFDLPFPTSPPQHSTSLIVQTYDEELNFMQCLFANNNYNSAPDRVDDTELMNACYNYSDGKTSDQSNQENVKGKVAMPVEAAYNVQPPKCNVSVLLGGVTTTPLLDYSCVNESTNEQQQMTYDQGCSSTVTKEMDLIEMVLGKFHYSHESNI